MKKLISLHTRTTHFSNPFFLFRSQESTFKASPTLWKEKRTNIFESSFWARHCIRFFQYTIVLVLSARQSAWSSGMDSCWEDPGSALDRSVLISWAHFPNPEFSSYTSIWMRFYFELFILPGKTGVRLNCKTPQLCIHGSASINNRVLVPVSGKTLLVKAPLATQDCSSQSRRAHTSLHIHCSPLMWSSVLSSNVILWILTETSEVHLGRPLSWAEPCHVTEMAY